MPAPSRPPLPPRPPATPAPPPKSAAQTWIAVKNTAGEMSYVLPDAVRAVISRNDGTHVIVGVAEILTYEPASSVMERISRRIPYRSEDDRKLAEQRSWSRPQDDAGPRA